MITSLLTKLVRQFLRWSSYLKNRFLLLRSLYGEWKTKRSPLPESVETEGSEGPEPDSPKPEAPRKQRFFLILAAALLLVWVSSCGLAWWWIHQLDIPFHGYRETSKVLWIPSGSHTRQILQQLETEGIVPQHRQYLAYAYLWWRGNRGGIKAGEYQFSQSPSLREVLEILIQGKIFYRSLTIPEGWDLRQVQEILASKGFGAPQEIQLLLHNPEPIKKMDSLATDLEGYLYPDTYFYTRDTTAREIVNRMVQRFQNAFTSIRQRRAQELGFSIREVVVLASLIEKETSLPAERPLISAVFHRRLKLGIRLQCDPTVIYASSHIGKYDGVIRQSDLNLDSPYNTYRIVGLPSGPIANPGEASLEAALQPAESDYLYFVATGDGGHRFSTTLIEHNKAVQLHRR
jgi:UPF0755 protein